MKVTEGRTPMDQVYIDLNKKLNLGVHIDPDAEVLSEPEQAEIEMALLFTSSDDVMDALQSIGADWVETRTIMDTLTDLASAY